MKHASLALPLLFALTAAPAFAGDCPSNLYPVTFVDAGGARLPVTSEGFMDLALAAGDEVYLALDPSTPSGTYYVQVANYELSAVLATTEQLDRRFEVFNDDGTIWVTRLSSTVGLPDPGLGLDGVGQSIPLFPLVAPQGSDAPCVFKVLVGTRYSEWWYPALAPLGLPWGPQGGADANGECSVLSYAFFRIGDGSGTSTVAGALFEDLDQDGVRGPGEPGKAGVQVLLSTGDELVAVTTTDASGAYSFTGLPTGSYEVALGDLPGGDHIATTATSFEVSASGCTPVTGQDFGFYRLELSCQGRTPGFWSNRNGKLIIEQGNLLARLPLLSVRTANGGLFTTTNYSTYHSWLKGGNAVNMAYKLSAHVVAMDFNLAAGFVSGGCTIQDPLLNGISIDILMVLAVESLSLHGYTPPDHPQRAYQERLKNALDAANNNQNWQ